MPHTLTIRCPSDESKRKMIRSSMATMEEKKKKGKKGYGRQTNATDLPYEAKEVQSNRKILPEDKAQLQEESTAASVYRFF